MKKLAGWTLTLGSVALLAILLVVYSKAYFSAAQRVCGPGWRPATINGQQVLVFEVRALFGERERILFAPIHAVDRTYLRPGYWKKVRALPSPSA